MSEEVKTTAAPAQGAAAGTATQSVSPVQQDTGKKKVKKAKKEKKPHAKMGKKKIILIVILAVVALLILRGVLATLFGGVTVDLGNYTAEQASYRDMSVEVSGTGTILANNSATITGMVAGDILTDSFAIGDTVEKDQILYTIDSEDAQTSVQQAELAVQQAELSYRQAQEAAKDLSVSSTVSGRVSDINCKNGDTITAGTVVATVTDNETMTIKCNFNTADAKNIYSGASAVVTMTATGETLTGTVRNVSGYTTVGSGGTLVQSVEIAVNNPGGITGGMAATAKVGTAACQSGGTFEYAAETTIISKVSGTIDQIYVSEGSRVSNGTALIHVSSVDVENSVSSAALSVENAKLSLQTAQSMLDNYSIKAPISGTITEKNLSAGDSVGQAGTTSMAVISDMSALKFDMKIDELDISKVAVGQSVAITVDALPGQNFTGYVDAININGETVNGVTSYVVTVMVDNPSADLLPGMNVSADIQIENVSHALTIPMDAVGRENTVQVIPASAISEKDGSLDTSKAESREVKLGVNDADYVQILSGMKEGEYVLIAQDIPGAVNAQTAGTTDDMDITVAEG